MTDNEAAAVSPELIEALDGLLKWSDNVIMAHGLAGQQKAVLRAHAALIRHRLNSTRSPVLSDEQAARLFHDTYERLAPSFGYETRPDTKAFDPTSPNGRLMIAVCGAVIEALSRPAETDQ